MWFFSWDPALLEPRVARRISNPYLQKRGHPHAITLRLCHLLPPALLSCAVPGQRHQAAGRSQCFSWCQEHAPHSVTLLTEMVTLQNQ